VPQKKQPKDAESTTLSPVKDFENTVRKILGVSKKDSDKQMAAFQASNRKRREKRRPKS
jgi:hypothetical protein